MIRIVFLILLAHASFASPVVVKELSVFWLEYKENSYKPIKDSNLDDIRTVYFHLNGSAFRGQDLFIKNAEEINVFINGKLISSGKRVLLNVDSLSNLYSQSLFVGVHSEVELHQLMTQIVSRSELQEYSSREIPSRGPTFFKDYAIIATAILSIFLLALFRTNPQLTLDYFSFAKIFSVQERNENLLTSRIGSSVNLLFYLFCALLTGFLLSAIFYFANSYFLVAKPIQLHSVGQSFYVWMKLSLFILLLLASKLIIVLFFSSVFNFRETVSFQFFNFLRFVLFTSVVMALLSLGYFIFRGQQPIFYERLIIISLVLLSAGSVMVLIKLLARADFSFFHLFSYLCASEIIPLVIIIKIFF